VKFIRRPHLGLSQNIDSISFSKRRRFVSESWYRHVRGDIRDIHCAAYWRAAHSVYKPHAPSHQNARAAPACHFRQTGLWETENDL